MNNKYNSKILDNIGNIIAFKTPHRGENWYNDIGVEILDMLDDCGLIRGEMDNLYEN